MPATLQPIAFKDAAVVMPGGALVAASPADQSAQGSKGEFEMILYTGSPFTGHWYWGDVYLDVQGFKPARQDVPACWNHMRMYLAGATKGFTADPAQAQIRAKGKFLEGTEQQEPTANMIRRRLDQNYPYQCSGTWVPSRVERVLEGTSATVNGRTVNGPCTIFRQFDCREASFTETGWDAMTSAVAASADAGASVPVEIINQEKHTMTTTAAAPTNQPATPAPAPAAATPFVKVLAAAFGADRALELIATKPNATNLADFSQELAADLTSVRASLDAEVKAHAQTKDDLAKAKAAPVVITASGDPSKPEKKDEPGTAKTEEQLKAEYAGSKELQAEYGSVEVYVHAKLREQE
jgi:hypothetical protein